MTAPRVSRPRSLAEARALQSELAARVIAEDQLGPVRHVAGADATYDAGAGTTRAAAVLLTFPGLAPLADACARRRTGFPYLTGLLSFREAPAVLAALGKLKPPPDLLLVDGHGVAHPRRFGLASHLGVIADVPTIGVAKSRLVGTYREPGQRRGAWTPLSHRGEVVGAVVRTRARTRPVFVSVGHRVSLPTAIELVLACAPRYRLPEPIRAADRLSRAPA